MGDFYGAATAFDQARALVPHNNATSLQVTVAVLATAARALESGCREPVAE